LSYASGGLENAAPEAFLRRLRGKKKLPAPQEIYHKERADPKASGEDSGWTGCGKTRDWFPRSPKAFGRA